MSKKKKSKKENPESVWPINEKMINPEVVCLYGPPKDLPCKKSKKTKNEKDDKEK